MVKLLDSDITTREVLEWQGLHLFHCQISSCSQKLRIFLALKGIDWESHPVELRTGENFQPYFLGINPRGLLPVLVHNGAVHIESNDIIEYLEATFPEPPLIPAGFEDRVHELLQMENDLHLDLRTITFRFVFVEQQGLAKDPKLLDQYKMDDGKVNGIPDPRKSVEIAFWEQANSEEGITDESVRAAVANFRIALFELDEKLTSDKYVVGDQLSVVDIAWFIYCSRIEFAGYPLTGWHPNVSRWYTRLKARDEFAREVSPAPQLLHEVHRLQAKQAEEERSFQDIIGE